MIWLLGWEDGRGFGRFRTLKCQKLQVPYLPYPSSRSRSKKKRVLRNICPTQVQGQGQKEKSASHHCQTLRNLRSRAKSPKFVLLFFSGQLAAQQFRITFLETHLRDICSTSHSSYLLGAPGSPRDPPNTCVSMGKLNILHIEIDDFFHFAWIF